MEDIKMKKIKEFLIMIINANVINEDGINNVI